MDDKGKVVTILETFRLCRLGNTFLTHWVAGCVTVNSNPCQEIQGLRAIVAINLMSTQHMELVTEL